MRLARPLAAALAIALAAACTDAPVGPSLARLEGPWKSEQINAPGALVETFVFEPGGRFHHTIVSYTRYPQQQTSDAAYAHTTRGTFELVDERLLFEAESVYTFNGATGETTARAYQRMGFDYGFFADARIAIIEDRLHIRFTGAGPTDGPETKRKTFTRTQFEL